MFRALAKYMIPAFVVQAACSPCSLAANLSIGQIHLAADLPPEQSEQLALDFEVLRNFSFRPENGPLLPLLKVDSLNRENLMAWLEARVKYVVSEKFDLDHSWFITHRHAHYPQAKVFPEIEMPKINSALRVFILPAEPVPQMSSQLAQPLLASPKLLTPARVFRVMDNLSAPLYLSAKRSHQEAFLDLKEAGRIRVLSHRLGLIRIGEGLFQRNYGKKDNPPHSLAYSLYRISNFLHEARHSDGNGKTLGFNHALCPQGKYQNKYSCDRNSNGPYRIQAEFLKAALRSCTQCSAGNRAVLQVMIADLVSRQIEITPGVSPGPWDDAPEFVHE